MICRVETGGKKVSLLGYGAMRFQTVDGGHANPWSKDASKAEIDQKLLNAQIKLMLDGGVNYFDTSPAYCRGESERRLGEALAASGYPRDSYVIATKLSNFAGHQRSLADAKAMFEKSLRELRTDYIDNYLLHSVGGSMGDLKSRFIDNGAVDWLLEERKAGRIRNLGFSFHGKREVFDWCMENHAKYRWDFAMIQMNYVDWNHPGGRNVKASYLYGELEKRGIPVVCMEPLLGGSLARHNHAVMRELVRFDPEATPAKWALRFCGSYRNVMCVLSGMTRTEHMEENIATFSPFKPCSEEELAALERAAVAYKSGGLVGCTSCNYCMPCPYGLDIPGLMKFRNDYLAKDLGLSAKEVLAAYAKALPEPLRRAEHCTGCGICAPHCPQQIDIPKEIAAIDRVIDSLKDEVVQ